MKLIILFTIRFYQRYLSFDRGLLWYLFPNSGTCRFRPTCSQYCYEAVEQYGTIRGLTKGILRISKCHPWSGKIST